MRVVFAGTPPFAAAALEALLAAGHHVVGVLTQPDRPAGRGLRLQPSAVKTLALARGLPVAQPAKLSEPDAMSWLQSMAPEVMVVAAYGLLLPRSVLVLPERGCLNIHASLLPRWRGAAPIQRAILAGDPESGISIMQMDEGLDIGAVRMREALPIASDDTAASLHDRLAALGSEMIVRALHDWPPAVPQDAGAACYAAKISKAEAVIDWAQSAEEIARRIRAYNPMPGAATSLHGNILKIWRARPVAGPEGQPGAVEVADDRLFVSCGIGAIELLEMQQAGSKRVSASAYLSGHGIVPGTRLGV